VAELGFAVEDRAVLCQGHVGMFAPPLDVQGPEALVSGQSSGKLSGSGSCRDACTLSGH
jgi:hypothetical protein